MAEMGNPSETDSTSAHGILRPGDKLAERNYDNDPQKRHRKEVRQNVRGQVNLSLDALVDRYRNLDVNDPTRIEALQTLDRIHTEKKAHPDKSYFEIIKNELDRYEDVPDARNLAVANVLVTAREIITKSASEEGLFQKTKDLLDEAEKIKDPVEMQRAIETIVQKADVLDAEATRSGSRNPEDVPYYDHVGAVKEYVRVAKLNLDLANLIAEGKYYVPGTRNKTKLAEKLENQIDLYGWGFPPLTLVEQAKDRMKIDEVPPEKPRDDTRRPETAPTTPTPGEIFLANKERLTKEDESDLYEAEKAWLEKSLEKYMRELVANANENKNVIVDYSARRKAEQGLDDMENYITRAREEVMETVKDGTQMPERAQVLLDRFEMLQRWMKANYYETLVNANYMGIWFFDGEEGLRNAVKVKERLDPQMSNFDTGVDMETLFKGLTPQYAGELGRTEGREIKVLNEGEWRFGEEIIRKQNEMNRFLRAVAAVHRHNGRNGGVDITPQLRYGESGEVKDYKVNKKIIAFVEGVFGSYTEVSRVEKTPKDGGGFNDEEVRVKIASEKIRTIDSVSKKEQAEAELKGFFEEQEMRDERHKKKTVDVAVGNRMEINASLMRDLSNVRKWSGWSMWIDGAEWKITPETIQDLQTELDWRIGSGDKVFVGKVHTVDKRNYKDVRNVGNQEVAVLRDIPPAIDNPFVTARTGDSIKLMTRKESWIINHPPVEAKILDSSGKVVRTEKMSLWESLDRDDVWVDAEALAEEFNASLATHFKVDQIDRHVMDMARLGILGRAEGHEVGWGFEYESARVGGTREAMDQRGIGNLRRQFQREVTSVDPYRIILDGKEQTVSEESLNAAERWARKGQKIIVKRYDLSRVSRGDIARWKGMLERREHSTELDACKVMINGKEESLSPGTIKKIEEAIATGGREPNYIRYTLVNKRTVNTGGTKECTDAATPADMLRTNAGDVKKGWPPGMMPISLRESKWILHHEPGWRPNWDKKTRSWGMYYFGVWIPYNVPAKFNLNLWNSAKVAEGPDKDKSIYRVMMEGRKMSDLPLSATHKDAMYSKGLIDWSQIWFEIGQMKRTPTEDTMALHGDINYEGPINTYTNAQKKGSLGFRTFGAGESDVVNVVSHLSALTLAYRLGLLPTSNNIHNRIEGWQRDRIIKHTSQSLANIVVNEGFMGAQERRDKFLTQMEQLKIEGDYLRGASRMSINQGRPLEVFQMQDERKKLGLSYVDYYK